MEYLTEKNRIRNKCLMILFAALSLVIILFIFGNSLQGGERSNKLSKVVTDMIQPKVDPEKRVDRERFNHYLRKVTHVAEFFALGICVAGFTINLGKLLGRRYISMPMLIVLCVSVTDEYIQHFTGRSSAVKDVVLDMGGSLLGLAAAALFCWVKNKIVWRKIV